MTTTMLIQQTGLTDHIHLSETTADALVKAGKQNWIYKREEKLSTEEKGEIQTYWLIPKTIEGEQQSHLWINDNASSRLAALGDSKERWIHWNAQTFTAVSYTSSIMFSLVKERSVSHARCSCSKTL
jgi:hypothetical protein